MLGSALKEGDVVWLEEEQVYAVMFYFTMREYNKQFKPKVTLMTPTRFVLWNNPNQKFEDKTAYKKRKIMKFNKHYVLLGNVVGKTLKELKRIIPTIEL